MRSVFWRTNPSTHFLLLRTLAVPSPISFPLHQNPHLRQILRQNPPIQNRALLQATSSIPPMDSIKNNDNINEFERIKEKEESPIMQNPESSSLSLDLPPQPPEKPEPGDCCGNGCIPCVWDLYYEEFEAYTKNLEEYNDRVSSKKN